MGFSRTVNEILGAQRKHAIWSWCSQQKGKNEFQ